jgi:hypothetical protein
MLNLLPSVSKWEKFAEMKKIPMRKKRTKGVTGQTERLVIKQLTASGDMMVVHDEKRPDLDQELEGDLEIELDESEPAFLRGMTSTTGEKEKPKSKKKDKKEKGPIVRSPEGSIQRAAVGRKAMDEEENEKADEGFDALDGLLDELRQEGAPKASKWEKYAEEKKRGGKVQKKDEEHALLDDLLDDLRQEEGPAVRCVWMHCFAFFFLLWFDGMAAAGTSGGARTSPNISRIWTPARPSTIPRRGP